MEQRDSTALEHRRILAVRLLRKGIRQAEVARRVGVHRQSVSRWAQQFKRGGERALKKSERAGRPARLHPEDLRRLERQLKRGPKPSGYESGGWTSERVAELIKRECKLKYDPSQAWRILRQLGWTWQGAAGTGEKGWKQPR